MIILLILIIFVIIIYLIHNNETITKLQNNNETITIPQNNNETITKPLNNETITKPLNNNLDITNSQNNETITIPQNNKTITKPQNNNLDITNSQNNNLDITNSQNNETITIPQNNNLDITNSQNNKTITNPIIIKNSLNNDNITLMNIDLCKNNVPNKLYYNNSKFNLIGTAINKIYNQEYKLYESKVKQCKNLLIRENLDYLDNQIYNYIFVNLDNNKFSIQQEFGPRNKINIGDIIYLDLFNGSSYIGPYIIL